MKKLIFIMIIVITLFVATVYVYVSFYGDSILTEHCENEVRLHKLAVQKVKERYSGVELERKLQQWNKTNKTVDKCIYDLKSVSNYNDVNMFTKARLIFGLHIMR